MQQTLMRCVTLAGGLIAGLLLCCEVGAQPWIVEDGRAHAEIVIDPAAAPIVRLAAEDLQLHVEKISGAKLPIVHAPSGAAMQLYVGQSSFTRQRQINVDDLADGGYRMVSGENWLALVGRDEPYQPNALLKLASHPPGSPQQAELWQRWNDATAQAWGLPFDQFWKQHNRQLGVGEADERGSFNAVADFLRMQGVRWYMPGPMGEVVPESKSIALPKVDKTVRPDFALRYPYLYGWRFGQLPRELLLWQLRMGFHQAPALVGVGHLGHGIDMITGKLSNPKATPRPAEYYALLPGGARDISGPKGPGRQCLSSQALFEENVAYVRALFDLFGAPAVSVCPTDGFTSICQCDQCRDQVDLQRGWHGQLSNYVWNYVNRVATEVYKTHPDRKIIALAYTTYRAVPTSIDQLSPNVLVGICQHRTTFDQLPEEGKTFAELHRAWAQKLPAGGKSLFIYDYYRYAAPSIPYVHMPVFAPHAIARDLRSVKDISIGDFIEVYLPPSRDISPDWSVTHLNLYVTAQLWWNASQDVDALLEEYYTLFYGPAAEPMRRLIDYAEHNYADLRRDTSKIDTVLAMLDEATSAAPASSVYAQRIALLAAYLAPLKDLREQLAKARTNPPLIRMVHRDLADLTLDGKLDEPFWNVPGQSRGRLLEVATGREPFARTTFTAVWAKDTLCLGIRCEELDTSTLAIATQRHDDSSIWDGDCIEVLLETQSHSYYQIAINPAGAVVDLDRVDHRMEMRWSSNAKAAVHVGDGAWTLEVLIPIADEAQASLDPLNGVAGRSPTDTYPWYFNLCRQRAGDNETELSAFSPTGKRGFHVPMAFGRIQIK